MKDKKSKGKSKDLATNKKLSSSEQEEILLSQVIPNPSNKKSSMALHASSFRGPIPPAQEIAKYEEVLPGAADRLFSMAEKDQEKTLEWERSALEVSKNSTKLGQWMGFSISIVAIFVAAYIALRGATEVGIAIVVINGIGILRASLRDLIDKYLDKS